MVIRTWNHVFLLLVRDSCPLLPQEFHLNCPWESKTNVYKFRFHFEIPFINSTVEINLCCCFFSFTITLSSRRGIIQISLPTREELNKYFSSILLNPTHCFALSLQLCGTLGFATNRRWERTQVSILCILN